MKVIPQSIKDKILEHLKDGLSCREIAKQIPSVSHMTVSRLQKAKPELPRIRAGRPQKLSHHDKRKVVRDISSGKTENAVLAAREISILSGQAVHPENVRRVLRKAGLKSIKKKRSRFSLRNIENSDLNLPENTPIGRSKILRELYGLMRQKLIEWVPMG